MKQTILCALFLAATLCPTLSKAQEEQFDYKPHAVKANILSLLSGSFDLNYEYNFGRHSGVAADLAYGNMTNNDKNALMSQLQYRFYFIKLRRWGAAMPFFGAGLNYCHAWRMLNCFDHNDGWDIYTRPYKLTGNSLRPEMMLGLRVNTPGGITIESTAGVLLGDNTDPNSPVSYMGWYNYITTQFSLRLGYNF